MFDDRWLKYWRSFGIACGLIYLVVLVFTPPEQVRPEGRPRVIAATVGLFVLAAWSWRTLRARRAARVRAHVLNRMGE